MSYYLLLRLAAEDLEDGTITKKAYERAVKKFTVSYSELRVHETINPQPPVSRKIRRKIGKVG